MPVSDEELNAMLAEADEKITMEQLQSGVPPEEWEQQERAKWRWSAGYSRGMLQSAADLAGDFNTGIFRLLGPEVQDALAEIGMGRRSTQGPLMGITGKGAEIAGETFAMAGGAASLLTKGTVRTGTKLLMSEANPAISTRIAQGLQETIERMPRTFLASETAGGFGAGVAGGVTAREGGGPLEQSLAMLGGGIAGGVLPTIGMNWTRQAMNWALTNVAPWLDSGETLAALRLQRLSADPQAAARKAKAARPGVSPARATEDKNLMALEARILEDDPSSAAEFAQSLENARLIAQSELRDFAGDMRLPGEWERAVIERVAAPGTTITLSDPQTMLKQANKSFRPVYKDFAGYPVKPQLESPTGEITMEQAFKMNTTDETILASDKERAAATAILKDELSRLKPAILNKDTTIDSADLLTVRQNLRDKISNLTAKRSRDSHITARILSNAEASITLMLRQQLPDEAMTTLKTIDDQYNTYRIVEQSVMTAGDRKLSGEALGQAIKKLAPRGMGDLRAVARAGRDIDSVLGDPRAARLMAQGQPGNVRKQLQGDFFNTLWQRSLTRELSTEDTPFVSGERFLNYLVEHKATAKALGINDATMGRATEIAKQIRAMEAKSPAALRATLEDGPASIMQLLATLIGAKSGQRIAGAGIGSSLVMAQFTSNRARKILSTLFRDSASDLLLKASKNKELYAALLTKSTANVKEQDKAARVIAAWLDPTTEQALDQDE